LPDPVPIESEEERAAREQDEIAALVAVGTLRQTQLWILWKMCLKTLTIHQDSEIVVCMCFCVC
jgi:hypothetical protein